MGATSEDRAMAVFGAWQLSDLTVSGPDPFGTGHCANAQAVGATRIRIDPRAFVRTLNLADDTPDFAALDLGGAASPPPAQGFVARFGYLLRPEDGDAAAPTVIAHVITGPEGVYGLGSSGLLFAGHSYEIAGIAPDEIAPAGAEKAVCFARGTRIATKHGAVPVEALRPGMLVQTADNGFRPLIWAGRWRVPGTGEAAPIRIAHEALGNERSFEVSPEHRMVIRPRFGPMRNQELLVPARALLDRPGICRAPRPRAEWLHLLFEEHEVIFAEGIRAESLQPGPQILAGIGPEGAAELVSLHDMRQKTCAPVRPALMPARIAPPGPRPGARCGGVARFLSE